MGWEINNEWGGQPDHQGGCAICKFAEGVNIQEGKEAKDADGGD